MSCFRKCVLIMCVFIVAFQRTSAFHVQSLNGTWTVTSNVYRKFDGQVPGGIYSDLMHNALLPDVFREYGDVTSRWVGNTTWTYTRLFDVEAAIFNHTHVNLIFEGVDTFATIHLNGKLIATTDNMFVRYELPIDGLLQVRGNELIVTFDSPIAKAKQLFDEQAQHYIVPPRCVPDLYNGECHVNHVRKMQASFGWDWGPAFPSVGLWKSVYINAYNQTYIKDITVDVRPIGNDYNFVVTIYMASNIEKQLNGVLHIVVAESHNTVHVIDVVARDNEFLIRREFNLPQDQFELWWPNGYGVQRLYPLTVYFISRKREVVSRRIRIGIRQVELVQAPVGDGLSFYFRVNGVAIFAKGSNMVPSHILPENSNNASLITRLLKSAKDVHMNMLRVWGGGLYESDLLYELADEMGIMIWQDFMFACSMYPVNVDFLRSVEEEVKHQVRRLQHHPSIVLWAGNNENEAALTGNWYGTYSNKTRYYADYRQLYGKTIRDVVLANDASREYLSSSPTNGAKSEEDDYISENPGDSKYGDVHFYNYFFDSWNVNIYPTPRFASEYGYQALPSFNSMATVVSSLSSLHIDSKFMTHRQHHPLGNTEMEQLIKARLEITMKNIQEPYTRAFFFYSQIIQAMAVKIETEHYRQWQSYLNSAGDGLTMGALYWQLNCPWLAPSWSGVESTGKWMMLHYYAKDFFAPIIVTSHQYPNQTVDLYVVSDRLLPISNASLKITIFKWNSLIPIDEKVRPIDIRKGSLRLARINLNYFLGRHTICGVNYKDCVIRLNLLDSIDSKKLLAPANYIYPVALKNADIPFANVQIDFVSALSTQRFFVHITTDQPAAFVWLESSLSGVFSENGFIMLEQSKQIVFESEEIASTKDFLNSLQITHLRDKFYFP